MHTALPQTLWRLAAAPRAHPTRRSLSSAASQFTFSPEEAFRQRWKAGHIMRIPSNHNNSDNNNNNNNNNNSDNTNNDNPPVWTANLEAGPLAKLLLSNECVVVAGPLGSVTPLVDQLRRTFKTAVDAPKATPCALLHMIRAANARQARTLARLHIEVDPRRLLPLSERTTDRLPPALLHLFHRETKAGKGSAERKTLIVPFSLWRAEWALDGTQSSVVIQRFLKQMSTRIAKRAASRKPSSKGIPVSSSASTAVSVSGKGQSTEDSSVLEAPEAKSVVLRSYKLAGARNVLPPTRLDYLELFERVMDSIKHRIAPGDKILEVGTGTGILAVMLRMMGASKVVATDVSREAVDCAKANLNTLGVSNVEVLQADVFPTERNHQFDLIVFNPPWLPCPNDTNIPCAVYDDGFSLIHKVLQKSKDGLLSTNGRIILIFSNLSTLLKCKADNVANIARTYGFSADIIGEESSKVSADDKSPLASIKRQEKVQLWLLQQKK